MIERWIKQFDSDFIDATDVQVVCALCSLHDFQLCGIYTDVDFRNDAYLLMKAPPTLLHLDDEAWGEQWPNALVKLSQLRSAVFSQIQRLDRGPAGILESTFSTKEGVSALTVLLSPNDLDYPTNLNGEVQIGFSFGGQGKVVFFDNLGSRIAWRLY